MDMSQIEALAKRANDASEMRDVFYGGLLDQEDTQVTYSTEDVFRAFRSYPNKRSVRNELKELKEAGHKLNKLANNHFALTHDEVQWLAERRDEPAYEFRHKPAFVAVIKNLKGGVGKSTTTCNLADYLVLSPAEIASRKRVLIIDLDPQGSCTFHYLKRFDTEMYISAITLMSLPADEISKELIRDNSIQKTWINGLDIMPCSTDEGFVADTLYDVASEQNIAIHELLREKVIKHIENDYDFILIDCGPHMDAVMKATIGAVDGMFLPTTPKSIDFDSTLKFIERWPEMYTGMVNDGYDMSQLKFIKSFINMGNDSTSVKSSVYNDSAVDDLEKIFREDYIQCSLIEHEVHTRCMAFSKTVVSMSSTAFKKHVGERMAFVDRRSEVYAWGKQLTSIMVNEHAKIGE
ncbi:ParA family protein [Vibrio tubiashii]|uniref:ParA family protein n=1 Tax=Vibrio tubiashii TaxID=29498 RepID=UPI001EFD4E39|nr:ParA family protein [Vibrio tubiashii]MCG9576712.1 ParA family protein [Vibrio tubiashii]